MFFGFVNIQSKQVALDVCFIPVDFVGLNCVNEQLSNTFMGEFISVLPIHAKVVGVFSTQANEEYFSKMTALCNFNQILWIGENQPKIESYLLEDYEHVVCCNRENRANFSSLNPVSYCSYNFIDDDEKSEYCFFDICDQSDLKDALQQLSNPLVASKKAIFSLPNQDKDFDAEVILSIMQTIEAKCEQLKEEGDGLSIAA